MRRRQIIRLFAAALVWPQLGRAQHSGRPVIGFLNSSSRGRYENALRAFYKGLGEHGFVEGQTVAIEYRWAEDRNERLPALAADLVKRHVDVIAAIGSTPAALAAKAATNTIPIVIQVGVDPVSAGLITSLARPGSNVTGFTNLNIELGRKRFEILREVVPTATHFALLVNPTSPLISQSVTSEIRAFAQSLGITLSVFEASNERDFEEVSTSLLRVRPGGLIIAPDAFFISRSEQLAALSVRHLLPAITQFREFSAAGGLMSYGGSFTEAAHEVGTYTGRILRGEKASDLPFRQLTKVELVINLKTAKAIGASVPLSLLGRADEVIE